MLPSRPSRSLTVGLPANPRSRSASRPREVSARSEVSETGSREHRLRTQRSFGSLPSTPRSHTQFTPPPLPKAHERYYSDDSMSDASGTSSITSSSWRRGRGGGYASSRTSIEDGTTEPIKPRQTVAQPSSESSSRRTLADTTPSPANPGTLWSRVATAAGSLTINVGKAWAANISVWPGEETPPGQESRLTRALKAYHIAKAQDTGDLPDWLFEPHERQGFRQTHHRSVEREGPTVPSVAPSRPPRPRGLRGVYDAVAAERREQEVPTATTEMAYTRPNNRLDAIRGTRRGVMTGQPPKGLPSRPGRQKIDAF